MSCFAVKGRKGSSSPAQCGLHKRKQGREQGSVKGWPGWKDCLSPIPASGIDPPRTYATVMIVYKDLFSGDEAISDSYKIQPVMDGEEEVPGLFEVDSAMVPVGGGDIDIGCGNAFGGASEEEGADDTVEKENNISGPRAGFGYTALPFGNKDEFKEYMKEYVQKVRQALKSAGTPVEEIKAFMSEAPVFVKWLLGKFPDDLETFMTKSMNPDGGMVYSYYKEGASYPTFVYIKAGYKISKF